jgi:hypothetical protein
MKMKCISVYLFTALLLLFLGACGSSSDDDNSNNDDGGETSYYVSGLAAKGLVSGGAVEVYSLNDDGTYGELLGSATTASDGSYSVDIGDYTGPVVVEVTGGTYTDEATGETVKLDGALRAALASVSGDVDAAVTPLTEIAVRVAEAGGGLNAEKIGAANALLTQLIGADIVSTLPVDISDAAAIDAASDAETNYALVLAAISQLSENSGQGLTDLLEAIEADIEDSVLNSTNLIGALNDFLESDENTTGITEVPELIETIIDSGFQPTGDLAGAKTLLAAFLANPSQDNYDTLMTYMETLAEPASAEAYLFTAMADLMDIYTNEASDFLKDNGLTIDNIEALDPDLIASTLLNLSTRQEDAHSFFAEMESRLQTVYDYLANAEEADTFISLTGFDTIYLDDVDVKTMRAFTSGLQAVLILAQGVDLTIDNWTVANGDGTIDARDLIASSVGLTNAQELELYGNNPDLFTWGDTTKLAEFKDMLEQLDTDAGEVIAALQTVYDGAGLESRVENAFNCDSELVFQIVKAWHEDFFASVILALDDADTSFIAPEPEFVSGNIVDYDEGYAYLAPLLDIYLISFDPPEDGITLYSLMNGDDSVRDLIDYDTAHSTVPYTEGIRTRKGGPYEQIIWDDPMATFEIPEATITIDGDVSDWEGVPVFKSTSDYTVKIAGTGDNTYCIYFSYPDISSLLDSDDDDIAIGINSVWPWIDAQEVPEGYDYRSITHLRFGYSEGTIYVVVSGSVSDYGQPPGEGDSILNEYDTFETPDSGIVGIEAKYTGLDQLTGAHFINTFSTHPVTDGVHYHNEELMKLY